jgi:excisionase family DNA binding protein
MKRAGKRRREDKKMQEPVPLALRRKDAARALGLSTRTLDRAISRGDLVAKKYGSRTLVPRAEIERYLEMMLQARDKEKPPA